MTEVPINYRPRIGSKRLSTWKHGFAILSAAFGLARRYNPIMLYSALAGLFVIPAAFILGWVALEHVTTGLLHTGWALVGVAALVVAAQGFTLASVSILTRHAEERLIQEMRTRK